MTLPAELPTDPHELEALYAEYMSGDEEPDQADLARLMTARLRGRGLDPGNLKPQQIGDLLSESLNRMMMNLFRAAELAPGEEELEDLEKVIGKARDLQEGIQDELSKVGIEIDITPNLYDGAPSPPAE